ncbi:MAG: hypothetical protein ACLRSU_12585 [Thomasclavelia spiroformis]|uniref:hypothetical protein n=1 Tax=Thomasclavelia spiroformis TaxID=29348 RepID=UPI003990A8E8
MNIFDYRKKDFKEIRTDNNEKKYFIKFGKEFIEVPIEIYRVYKADYMKTYRLHHTKHQNLKVKFEEEFMLDKNKDNLEMDKYYIQQIIKKDSIHNLSEALKHLDSKQYYIIHSLFFEEKTESEIAKKLNISQQALNKRKIKILLILKKWLLEHQK